MGINIKEISSKKLWNKTLSKFPQKSFLQTWQWGDFQADSLGKKVMRLGLYRDESLEGLCLAVEEVSRFGTYVYSPRGPVLNWDEDTEAYLEALRKYFKESGKYVHYRSDPRLEHNADEVGTYIKLGFQSAANFVQVQRCWVLDVANAENEKELFKYAKSKGMSKSIPRHIRKAAKKSVTTRISDDIKDVDILVDFLNELAEEKGIPKRPDSYYRGMFEHMAPAGWMKFIIAEYEGEPISVILLATYGDEVGTLHGCSKSDLPNNLYASKKIYWDAMLYAMENGYKRFNFWGVLSDAQMEDRSHPSFGYSLFKKRFGGRELLFMDTKDYVYKRLSYIPLYLQEMYRKLRYKVD
jgi:lipid II:glycine glycyltransferase (peptidoglycan interpeptide bridge formation enzyme)